ncbi:MAG TPA: helix-turn-helix transcriptional regulator [Candidatus Dormibacteraeota bacterium]|nr:helix-turn-helix transcriptional regulator [Candidatus Dormibacteraeota bacterium]
MIEELHDAGWRLDGPHAVLARIAALIPCDVISIAYVDASHVPRCTRARSLRTEIALRFELAAVASPAARGVVVLALGRSSTDFSERDRALAERLVPHLRQALGSLRPDALPASGVRVWPTGDLTPREHEIVRCVADGATNRIIALRLGISPRTVQKHLEHVYEKLGVETRTAAAMRLGRAGSNA